MKGIAEYTVEIGMARALHLIRGTRLRRDHSECIRCGGGAPKGRKKFTATLSGINKILGIEVPARMFSTFSAKTQLRG